MCSRMATFNVLTEVVLVCSRMAKLVRCEHLQTDQDVLDRAVSRWQPRSDHDLNSRVKRQLLCT